MKHWKRQTYWHGDVALGCIRVCGRQQMGISSAPRYGAPRLSITTFHRRLRQSIGGHSNRTWRRAEEARRLVEGVAK